MTSIFVMEGRLIEKLRQSEFRVDINTVSDVHLFSVNTHG
jgi:hypothetical protein